MCSAVATPPGSSAPTPDPTAHPPRPGLVVPGRDAWLRAAFRGRYDNLPLTRATVPVLVPDSAAGAAADTPAGEADDDPPVRPLRPDELAELPPPTLASGHLITPIRCRPPSAPGTPIEPRAAGSSADDGPAYEIVALDVDEASRSVAERWAPCPSDVRVSLGPDGLDLAIDVPLVASPADRVHPSGATPEDRPYRLELVFEAIPGDDPPLAIPAALVPGPGTVGMLRAHVATERLRPDRTYVLSVRTTHHTSRLGLDLVVSPDGRVRPRRSARVSVIVPGYDANGHLGECLGSALAQSMPADEHEVIVVHDGAPGGTGDLLDWLTRLHPHLRVIHLAGAPGGPGACRDAGLDEARGEYVFFLDPSDLLAPTALEDLYATARAYDSDITLGRTVGEGVYVPSAPYRRNRPNARLADAPIAESLTPHKLFRRSFLRAHGLRFASTETEPPATRPPASAPAASAPAPASAGPRVGWRRWPAWLERSGPSEVDTVEAERFVAEAYLLARRISVYADRICYRRIATPVRTPARTPTDRGGATRCRPEQYAARLRQAVDRIERYVPAGPERLALLRRWYRREILHRLRGRDLLELADSERIAWFAELRELAHDRFADDPLTGRLSAVDRMVAALLTAGRLDALVQLAIWESGITVDAAVERLAWRGRTLHLWLRAALGSAGRPVLVRTAGRTLLDPPLAPPGWAALVAVAGPRVVDVSRAARRTRVGLVLRPAGPGAGEPIEIPVRPEPARPGLAPGSVSHAELSVPELDLGPGRWDLSVRVRCLGWSREVPLAATDPVLARQHPGLRLPRRTGAEPEPGRPLALDVGGGARSLVVRRTDPPARWPHRVRRAIADALS